MSEPGGASTQAGIYYQNSVAALALADLLELAPMPPRDRVTDVRVEAPGEVDDVVVRYADGHSHFMTVKTAVRPSQKAWTQMWRSLEAQRFSDAFKADDRLVLNFEESTPTTRSLREICDRASTSIDQAEWIERLSAEQTVLLGKVTSILTRPDRVMALMRCAVVKIQSLLEVEQEFARQRSGGDLTLPGTLLSILRDMVGGHARNRGLFRAPDLRRRLMRDHAIELTEPREWGLSAYRATLATLARIGVPGTRIAGPSETMFVWPTTRPYERGRTADFEDEVPDVRFNDPSGTIDLKSFPTGQFHRCVVMAGPGYGKSALLTALSGLHARGPLVPVIIPLASLAASDGSILEFLSTHTNRVRCAA
jgi:hypothetical protein